MAEKKKSATEARLEKQLTDLFDKYDAEVEKNKKLENDLEELRETYHGVKESLDVALAKIREMGAKNAELKAGEEWEQTHREMAELEVIKLKAKLYDIMSEE